MCFQSPALGSWPVKNPHFLNSTFTQKATLSWHLLWSKSSSCENCCPKWCMALHDWGYSVVAVISAAACSCLCCLGPKSFSADWWLSSVPTAGAQLDGAGMPHACMNQLQTYTGFFRVRLTFSRSSTWLLEVSSWSPNRQADIQMQWLGHLATSGTAGIKLGKLRHQSALQEVGASPGPLKTSSNLRAELTLHNAPSQWVEAHIPCTDVPEKMGILTPNSLCMLDHS